MYFRNEHHRQAFRDGMKKTNRKDKETVSAVYLLSAEPCLWNYTVYLQPIFSGG